MELELLREQNASLKAQMVTMRDESIARLQRLTSLEDKLARLVATMEIQSWQLLLLRLAVGADMDDMNDMDDRPESV